MGTLTYAAPEQLADARSADARADLWSLGVMLFELCTGDEPFCGLTLGEILGAQRAGADLDRLPEALRGVVGALLVADPERRLQDCGALLAMLPEGPPVSLDSPLGRRAEALVTTRQHGAPPASAARGDDTLAPLDEAGRS
jgi:serine/threonine protein kinase